MEQLKFKRYELKYLINDDQYERLKKLMSDYTVGDLYGKSTICNLYFDTPTYLLIRRSIEKPVYKEKLRLRCYGVPSGNSQCFLELKKKFKSVVFKRRIKLTVDEAKAFLTEGKCPEQNQVVNEIRYFLEHYEVLQPTVFLSYEREAFYGKTDKDFRITFDSNILWRDYDLLLTKGVYGNAILEEGKRLLEIKTANTFPLWLSEFLSKEKIFKVSFSKYGTAYKEMYLRRK